MVTISVLKCTIHVSVGHYLYCILYPHVAHEHSRESARSRKSADVNNKNSNNKNTNTNHNNYHCHYHYYYHYYYYYIYIYIYIYTYIRCAPPLLLLLADFVEGMVLLLRKNEKGGMKKGE